MPNITSRERLLRSLLHEEPDRVPYDLSSTQVTGISITAYKRLREYLGLQPMEPQVCDVIQQICIPHDDVMERLQVDTRGLFPLTYSNWNVDNEDAGEYWSYADEWGLKHRILKDGGLYYSLYASPIDETTLTPEAVDKHAWPDPADPRRIQGLRSQAEAFRAQGKAVVVKNIAAGIFEMACRLRGTEKFLMDLMTSGAAAVHLMRKVMEIKAAFWAVALDDLGDLVDVVSEADDYGTQESMFVSPEMFRGLIKPLVSELLGGIRKRLNDNQYIFFHSCGSVRELIPDFIEMGVDILNPVHITAKGMDPRALKSDFGKDICFWGGGCDTQHVLPQGTPDEVREDVMKNLNALAPGGGYVFNTVHNIQPDVPPENIVAMWEALQEFGAIGKLW